MSAEPTAFERQYYDRLVGCTVVRILWDTMEGRPLPVLLASSPAGGVIQIAVLCDPEGNGPGFLEIQGLGA